jgi:ribonuclease HI
MTIGEKKRLVVYADGACRGNPGPMAIGASIQTLEGEEIDTVSESLGVGTNNIAEYQAAIEGVRKAIDFGAQAIELRMDSQLLVRQLNGEYQVRHAALKPLWAELRRLLAGLKHFTITHVPREQNSRADQLANLAYSKGQPKLTGVEFDLAITIAELLKERAIPSNRVQFIMAKAIALLHRGVK